MTPRARLLATMRGQKADRVPLILEGFIYPSSEQLQAERDPARREIGRRILDQTASFLAVNSYANRYLCTPPRFMREAAREDRGQAVRETLEIDTPKGKLTAVTETNALTQTVWTVKYPVESLADVEKIRSVPWQLPEGLAVPELSARPADFDQRHVLRTSVSSPFVCVAGMMPYQYFLQLCATELGLIRELTEQCCQRILALLEVLLAPKVIEYVWMGGCEWLTPPMGSPALYQQLVQVFEERIIRRIHAGGALAHVHCHGKVATTLEHVIRRGGDYFEPVEPPPDGDITFAQAKALAAGRITLGGNVEARILENEGPDRVEYAARAAFEGGKGRMVLASSAGPIGPVTPRMHANYHRMIDVWEELSPL